MQSQEEQDKPQSVIDHLKAKCNVYRIERETLLSVIKELSDIIKERDKTVEFLEQSIRSK